MKQRLITAGVGLVILFSVLAFFHTLVLNVAIALIVVTGVLEVLGAAGCKKQTALLVASGIYAGAIPFFSYLSAARVFPLWAFCYIAVLFLILLLKHNEIKAVTLGFCFFIATTIPFSLTVAIYLRDRHGPAVALFLILTALACAWLCDSGAYFVGRAWGRHKLAPQISPNKTIEGAVGGIVVATVCTLLIALLYQWGCGALLSLPVAVNYPLLALVVPVVSVAGMLGDLSASVIKRQTGVKDFGNIMPGHGGVMDRFDSVFFTAPTIFMLTQYLSLIALA